MLRAERHRPRQHAVLNLLQQCRRPAHKLIARHRRLVLGAPVAARHEDGTLFDITRTNFNAHWNTLLHPLPHLVTTAQVTRVDLHFNATPSKLLRAKFSSKRLAILQHLRSRLGLVQHRQNHNVRRRQARRNHEAVIVGVRHDQRTNQTRAHAPTGCPRKFLLTIGIKKLNLTCLGKVLSQEVACSSLQCLAILHHGFNAIGLYCAWESLAFSLAALNHRHGHPILCKVRVHAQHLHGFVHGFCFRGVRSVAFLPEELRGAQEQARAHLPTNNIRPLVDEERKVAVTLHPLGKRGANDGLTGWSNDQWLIKFTIRNQLAVGTSLEAVMRHHCAFFGEAVNVRGLLLQE